jgi:hypothetical protein
MNRTRIEIATIPPELPAPHFDDEATIVSARQVVPIAQAKVAERSRMLLSVIPVLLGAAVFGALGALGVNYFENHQSGHALVSAPRSEIGQPINQAPTSQTKTETPLNSGTELPGGALAPAESSSPGLAGAPTQNQPESPTTDPTADQGTVDAKAGDNKALPSTPAAQPNSGNSPEPGKLIRKRRVHPQTQENERKTDNPDKGKRGAGRIQEIFAGPNPQ